MESPTFYRSRETVSSDFGMEIMVPLIWQTGILGNPDDRLPTGELCQAAVI
jgi:hypothetical protein